VTMRPEDNSFYWLSADEVNPKQMQPVGNWNPNILGARVCASIGKNQVSMTTESVNKVSIWLSMQHHVDFEQPLLVYVNTNSVFNQKVKPSLKTLLEDQYERGDRQRVFVARVELTVNKGK